MGLESALWEASRPSFRVRYIHDPNGLLHIPLYASYGVATARTTRAKLARIVRGAPEVVVKVTGRQRGGGHVKAHLDYIGRKGAVDIETRDGEILTSKEDIAERAAEWSDTLNWRSRPTVSSVSLIFSMPAGTDPDKVLGAVRALAHAELSDNHDYVLALHIDTPRPHVHMTVQAEGWIAQGSILAPFNSIVSVNALPVSYARGAWLPKQRRDGRADRGLPDQAWHWSNCGRAWRAGQVA
jgi:type IV secretion system T-DNA border endonuclease VirD2